VELRVTSDPGKVGAVTDMRGRDVMLATNVRGRYQFGD